MKRATLKVLLADDHEADRLLYKKTLGEIDLNIEVHLASSSNELMEYLATHDNQLPHLLLLNLNMAGNDGWYSLKEIKRLGKYDDMAIAVYGTDVSEKEIEEAFLNGANIYIHKPQNIESLKQVFKKALIATHNYQSPPLNKANFLLRL